MFVFRRDPDAELGVGVAFTSAALDLGDRQGPRARSRAVARVSAAVGVPLALVTQVHGTDVVTVGEVPEGPLPDRTAEEADALVTTVPGVALAVRVADCVPVCLAAVDASAVAAVHAGRQGLLDGVIPAAVARLRELTDADLRAWVGPHVCAACYEVPPAMADDAARRLGTAVPRTRWGSVGIDLGAAAAGQLERLGVAVQALGVCTREDVGLHSHRRDAAGAGRMVGMVWIDPGRAAPGPGGRSR